MKRLLIASLMSIVLAGCSSGVKTINKNVATNKISVDEAKEIALKDVNLTNDEVSMIEVNSEMDNGVEKYSIKFYHDNKEYDYEINSADGTILEKDYEAENYNNSNTQQGTQDSNNTGNSNSSTNNTNAAQSSEITLDKAKEIALNHANLTASQVTFIRSKLDIDDGIKKYDIEFYYENKEYDYEINAVDGSIIEYDFDVENYNPQQVQGNSNSNASTVKISQEQAKEIALKHANLKSDQVKFGKIKLDYDYGVQEYDIEFYYNNKEYSYEIDANTGAILSYEQD